MAADTNPGPDTQPISLTDRAAVEAAFGHHRLEPPPAPATIGSGATAALRSAMARFAPTDRHGERRRRVEAVVAGIAVGRVIDRTTEQAVAHLGPPLLELVADVARVAPVEALGVELGWRGPLETLVSDVGAVVSAIGRGAVADSAVDAATERLLAGVAAADPVSAVSLLYQTMDATASAIAIGAITDLGSRCAGRQSATSMATGATAPVPATVRLATADLWIGERPVAAGRLVELDLGEAGLPYGAGAHRCPGRELAEAMTAAVIDTVAGHGYRVDDEGLEWTGAGTPRAVPLIR